MSTHDFERFLDLATREPRLAEEVRDALRLGDGAAAALAALANDRGLVCSREDVVALRAGANHTREADELSDDELDAVSGGLGGVFRPISPTPVRPSFEDPLTAFEDPLTAFEDPLTAFRRP